MMDDINFLQDEEVLWQGTSSLVHERILIKYIGLMCTTPILFIILIHAFTSHSTPLLIMYIMFGFGAIILIFLIIRMYLRSYTERLKEPPEFYITKKRIISKDPNNLHIKHFPTIPSGITVKEKLIMMEIDTLSIIKFIKFSRMWNLYFYPEKSKNALWWIQFDGLESIDTIKANWINKSAFQCIVRKRKKEIYTKG